MDPPPAPAELVSKALALATLYATRDLHAEEGENRMTTDDRTPGQEPDLEAFRREVARMDAPQRTAMLAAVDELVAAIGTRDGDAGVAAVRRIQALNPEAGKAVLDHLADEGLRRMAGGSDDR
ncbi:hypothetical protein OHA25_59965 (plasmid) [Nonomuraea sp. NBC_00507]|uniref:hypothetical protein n=1 Tax=Nonomuraea sp. NBC_00507 TaxID=2976002 RepID=UPI002E175C9C